MWRSVHRRDREFSQYSATQKVHSRLDFFLMNTVDRHRVRECTIGTADMSYHIIVYLNVHLNSKPRNKIWRLNIGILNNKSTVD